MNQNDIYRLLNDLTPELSNPDEYYDLRDAAVDRIRADQYAQRCIRDQAAAEQAIVDLEELFGSDLSSQLSAAGDAAFMEGQRVGYGVGQERPATARFKLFPGL